MNTSEMIEYYLKEVNQDAFHQIFADFRDYINIRALLFYTTGCIDCVDWKKIYNTNYEQAYIGGKDGL